MVPLLFSYTHVIVVYKTNENLQLSFVSWRRANDSTSRRQNETIDFNNNNNNNGF